jgi:UTP:GlnB (protein PII) uridylyltransferase
VSAQHEPDGISADLAAVGPDVWDDWKAQIVSELFSRTMDRLHVM